MQCDDFPGGPVRNGFLRRLEPSSLARLRPHLEPVELGRRQLIYAAGEPITALYFPDRGLVSMIKTMADGASVEVGVVGTEGAVCLSAMLGLPHAILESLVHVPGAAWRVRAPAFRAAVDADPALRALALRYAEFVLGQMAQTTACNTLHPLEKRLCRWLLAAHDSVGGDTIPVTHEFLALMLGVQRPGLSLAAGALRKAGLVELHKGAISIADRAGIEAAACECHHTARASRAWLLDGA